LAFGGSVLIREVTFGGNGLIRGELLLRIIFQVRMRKFKKLEIKKMMQAIASDLCFI
jgi:hypothetical protein